jgi:hypothetical protein
VPWKGQIWGITHPQSYHIRIHIGVLVVMVIILIYNNVIAMIILMTMMMMMKIIPDISQPLTALWNFWTAVGNESHKAARRVANVLHRDASVKITCPKEDWRCTAIGTMAPLGCLRVLL